ncbi:hypothetical protein BUALT_Bualt11G0119200 [Buddleja alternifolia]|uniref:Integral membrane bound transporter domain-containing protein n=1 Tax=Buddleja alternifolia TaxID=168488 RepID=A0AAV6X589_9LAMI|nr:hypothetical protein BUALT_Bualt11G0119200 [Buddleja alternifolia]
MTSTVAERYRIIWCMRLHSALRTALACAIVGGATMYGPKFLVREIKFAAFSYLTAVLIVSDAALGDTLKGCWHALCATVQVVPVAMLARWLIAPEVGIRVGTAALAVAVAAFVVALPEGTHMTAKRIAFGQIVLVCSDAVVSDGGGSDGYMRPVYVAASTALGALASLLALMVPYPDLAYYKVRKLCRVYAENASERMNLYVRAFKVQDNHTKMALISQAKPLAETGNKLLHSIKSFQDGMKWERPWSLYLNPNLVGRGDRLQSMELPMRGIEYSLASSPAFPVQVDDKEHLSNVLQGVSNQLGQKIEQVKCFPPFYSMTEPETGQEFKEKPLLPLEPISRTHKSDSVHFFFSCIDMLLNDANFASEVRQNRHEKSIKTFRSWLLKLSKRLEFAIKCSLSLGLAMLFGLIFDKENGCWAGLTIAISFVKGRQAIFTIANTRAQGTAIGSVYGVICCFIFHYEELRLLALLPWIIITSFLRHSRMYSQTGGVSAAIGALLILGRKNYGSPNEFALARLAEVFIGLSSFVMVELFLQPTRATTLAKTHLHMTLCALQDCIKETRLYLAAETDNVSKFHEFRDKQRNLESLVCELKKFVEDAETEPSFWYLPFRTSCYQKLVESLSTIADLLYFLSYNFEVLQKLAETSTRRNELQEQMNSEIELFQENLSSSLKILEKAHLKESKADSQDAMDEKLRDLETGKLKNEENLSVISMADDKEKQRNAEEDEEHDDNKKNLDERRVQCLGAIGFCINSLSKERIEIEICIKEIERWEYQSSQ